MVGLGELVGKPLQSGDFLLLVINSAVKVFVLLDQRLDSVTTLALYGYRKEGGGGFLKAFTYRACSDAKPIFKSMVPILSKSALLASFSIFAARAEPSWVSPPFLNVY